MFLPVLKHICIDSRTPIETQRDMLDSSDLLAVGNHTTETSGNIGRLMVARMQPMKGDLTKMDRSLTKPRVSRHMISHMLITITHRKNPIPALTRLFWIRLLQNSTNKYKRKLSASYITLDKFDFLMEITTNCARFFVSTLMCSGSHSRVVYIHESHPFESNSHQRPHG